MSKKHASRFRLVLGLVALCIIASIGGGILVIGQFEQTYDWQTPFSKSTGCRVEAANDLPSTGHSVRDLRFASADVAVALIAFDGAQVLYVRTFRISAKSTFITF